jgi:hypothetical protein
MPALGQQGGQDFDVGYSPGQDEAVAASGQGSADVFDDLDVSAVVGDESAMCLGDGARRRDVECVVAERSLVDMQTTCRRRSPAGRGCVVLVRAARSPIRPGHRGGRE